MRFFRGLGSLGAALVLATAVGACGPGDAPRMDEEPTGDHATYSGGPPGGVLVVLADREPDELNPITYDSNPAFQAIRLMFRGLARRDSTLSGYQPDLATAWDVGPDSVVRLELRRDARWHDGTPVTADDVVFTIERQRDERTASPRQADVAAVRDVEAIDSFTVAVRLDRAGPYDINALLEVVPAPRHLLADVEPERMRMAGFGRNPVGNGFFRFVRWDAGQNLVLEANPDMPEGRPALDRVIMRFVPDVTTALTELVSGQGDLLRIHPDQRPAVESARAAEVVQAPRVRPAWIAWNTRMPPLDDPRVRRALLMAIDREAIVRGLFGEQGEVAWSPIPAALWEHSEGVRPIPHDPDGARRLLEEAGWTGAPIRQQGGRPLRIEVDYIATDQARADVLIAAQNMLRAIGVDLVPRAFESTAWVNRLRERQFQGSLWGWGWGPGVAGPNAEMVFHSRSIPPNGPNFAGYADPQVDALIDRILRTRDTDPLRAAWAELEQRIIDDPIYAPIYLDPEMYGVHSRFRGVRFRGIEWWEDVMYWWIPEGERLARDRAR